jgi:uncharacterized protein YfaS (alpha-2-macroglobulin family)
MLGALEYLTEYPYGCVEQTTSSFLPNIVVKRMLDELKTNARACCRAAQDRGVGPSPLRLQRPDGGWGWWRHDQADPG